MIPIRRNPDGSIRFATARRFKTVLDILAAGELPQWRVGQGPLCRCLVLGRDQARALSFCVMCGREFFDEAGV